MSDKEAGRESPLGGWAPTLVAWLVTVVTIGTGTFQVQGGEVYGRLMFAGFKQTLSLSVPNGQFLPGETYARWSSQILGTAAQNAPSGLWIFVLFIVLAVLLAHVTSKPEPAKERVRSNDAKKEFWKYPAGYHWLTLALAGVGLVWLLNATHPFWLVASALLLILPLAVYLLLHSRDVTRDQWLPRFTYLLLLIVLPLSVAAFPYQYGKYAFDVRLFPVTRLPANRDVFGFFIVDEKIIPPRDVVRTLGQMINTGNGWVLPLTFPAPDSTETALMPEPLRQWATTSNNQQATVDAFEQALQSLPLDSSRREP